MFITIPPKREHTMPCRTSTRVDQKAKGARKKQGPDLLLWFSLEGESDSK